MTSIKKSELLLVIFIVLSFSYNYQISAIRAISMALWMIIPLVLFINIKCLSRKLHFFLVIYLFYLVSILISMLYRSSLLEFEISGPNVEQWTIILVIGHFFILLYANSIGKYNKVGDYSNIITKAYIVIVFVFILDLLARYYINPSCFMNYSCRYEAKTIGFYSTSNVSGQSLSALILSALFLNFRFKKTIVLCLSVILITTMARAAIVSTTVFMILALVNYIFRKNKAVLIVGYSAVFSSLLLFFILDPLGFRQDGSALSKLEFFTATYNVILSGSYYDFLFGYGGSYEQIVSLINVNGWSPHATILKSILYYGLVGIILYIYMYVSILKVDLKAFYAISAYYLLGLTGAPIYWPGLAGLYLIFYLNKYEKNTKQSRFS